MKTRVASMLPLPVILVFQIAELSRAVGIRKHSLEVGPIGVKLSPPRKLEKATLVAE